MPGLPLATSAANLRVDFERRVELAVAHARFEVGGRGPDRHLLALEKGDQRRRMRGARDRQLEHACPVRLRRDEMQDQHEEDRAEQRGHQRHERRAAIAQSVDDLLGDDRGDAARRRIGSSGAHLTTPTLAASPANPAAALPPEGAQFAPWGGPASLMPRVPRRTPAAPRTRPRATTRPIARRARLRCRSPPPGHGRGSRSDRKAP